MSEYVEFIAAEEIDMLAHECFETGVGDAAALPMPSGSGDEIRVTVMFYKEPIIPKHQLMEPPYYLVTIAPTTGDVVEARACLPSEFGVPEEPGVATEGFGLDPSLTGTEYRALKSRFFEISSDIWSIFATGSTRLSPDERALLREYRTIYKRIAKAPLKPYYESVASVFFEWMDHVLS